MILLTYSSYRAFFPRTTLLFCAFQAVACKVQLSNQDKREVQTSENISRSKGKKMIIIMIIMIIMIIIINMYNDSNNNNQLD